MIAIILCAGYATRLYPLTRDFPKPLLPVAGRPLLDYLVSQLSGLDGLKAIHVITNERFYRHFEQWRATPPQRLPTPSIPIELHNDGTTDPQNRLGALVDLKRVLETVPGEDGFLAAAGDNLFLFDLAPLWTRFLEGQSHLVVALEESDPRRLRQTGVALLAEDGRLLHLDEKPRRPASNLCIPPLYFLKASGRARLCEYLAAGGEKDAPGHFIAYLCRKEVVYAQRLPAPRADIGDPESYRRAEELSRAHLEP